LTVIAGGGVREENVNALVRASGVSEVHVRLTRLVRSEGAESRDGLHVRKPLPIDETAWEETDEQRIRSFVGALRRTQAETVAGATT
jgi:copper homeostasis protein CutC